MEKVCEPALTIRFLNVGDGDAVYIDENGFKMLVDTGRELVPEGYPASMCAEHLKAMSVTRLDLVVITHLHIDHMGGLAAIMDAGIKIDSILSAYFPKNPGAMMIEEPDAEPTVQKMIGHLNCWSKAIERLKSLGTRFIEIENSRCDVHLTEKLSMDIILPDEETRRTQIRVWEQMFEDIFVEKERKVFASKSRNPNSLRLRLHYAGREVELSGDCLGAVWENDDLTPCDIFKLPHHGDSKSITPTLIEKLRPKHAVISAGRNYLPAKDRPSKTMAALCRSVGAEVWYTDMVDDGTAPVHRWPWAQFIIKEDGGIVPPEEEGNHMITTVLFDMGGTLEDIWVDEASDRKGYETLKEMLVGFDLDPNMDVDALKARCDEGWAAYNRFRDKSDVELKPVEIWRDYVLKSFDFPEEKLVPHCEEIAHMWEVTHFHRMLRPRVKEMLSGLKEAGLHLGVISNTAALYQVFDTLEEYGIRDFFEDVTLSSVTGFRKPCRDIFTVSLRQMCARPDECVYVGDTMSRDIIGSKRAGFAVAIQIASKLTKEKDAGVRREFEPDYVVEDIYDVLPTVEELTKKP